MTEQDFRHAAAKIMRILDKMTEAERVRVIKAAMVLSGIEQP